MTAGCRVCAFAAEMERARLKALIELEMDQSHADTVPGRARLSVLRRLRRAVVDEAGAVHQAVAGAAGTHACPFCTGVAGSCHVCRGVRRLEEWQLLEAPLWAVPGCACDACARYPAPWVVNPGAWSDVK